MLAFSLRIAIVFYSNFHDENFNVPYTDIDYKVFTDSARYLLDGMSPYNRQTYRYSPLLALLLTPNILINFNYGKFMFSFIDILVAMLIKTIVDLNHEYDEVMSTRCACLWLFNPLVIIISTRGNADCLAAFLVILSLYFLKRRNCLVAGFFHGISVHFRLYPLPLSLGMYLSLRQSNRKFINMSQIKFTLSCLFSLIILTVSSYYFYGYMFLYESLIFHLIRKDTRHNFSVFFYTLYLSTETVLSSFIRILNFAPQLLLLITLSGFYSSEKNLAFALMTQAYVIVIYNSVITSQYFFWFLSIFPICFPILKCSFLKMLILFGIWISSQGIWLFMAYLLEFQSINSFNCIWLSSIIFYIANIKILIDLIEDCKL